jgi:hypothetical protein
MAAEWPGGTAMNTADVTSMIDRLSVDAEPVEFQQADDAVKVMGEFVADAKSRIAELKLEWIDARGEDMVIGDVRYYAGEAKTDKCRDAKRLLDTFITEHSIDDLAACLSSNAFKPGACKPILGNAWGEHFVTESKPVIKEGKPVRGLQAINTRFVK